MTHAAESGSQLLGRSWSEVSRKYDRDLVPKFLPWTNYLLELFLKQAKPAGSVVVPACGPGHELVMLAKSLPDHKIYGIDLADGMIEVANERINSAGFRDTASAAVGDATTLPTDWKPVAGIFSVFGLQQIPNAPAVLAQWLEYLAPAMSAEGVLAVCYWGAKVEAEGPWRLLSDMTARLNPNPQASATALPFDADIPRLAVEAGGKVLLDERKRFTMCWSSIEEFWDTWTKSGPWHARKLQFGEPYMQQLKELFMNATRDFSDAGPIEHEPEARIVVLQKVK